MATKQLVNARHEFSEIDETKSYLYEELWKLCAGPLFDIPKFGEKVYYFPQGHIEHLEAFTKDDLRQIQPIFDIPSKIRCNVTGIELKVENDTDNIYAQITLLPDIAEGGRLIPNGNQENQNCIHFTKVLTASDVSTHGGFSILKRHAIECLPPLDMSQPTPTQEIVAKDLHDYEWRFKHIFRGTPKRHIFTTGWSAFVIAKKLVVGDSFIFLRGEDGESRVGIRRAVHQHVNILSSVISEQTMHHGIVASALYTINTKCMFNIFCKPRLSQFVVNFNKVIDALNEKFNVGSRFVMRFEGEDFVETRYSGTIVRITDFSIHWDNSEWRCLEVQWDKAASIPRPDKVSPWEIEHLAPSSNITQSTLLKNKRSRHVDEFGSDMWTPTLTQGQEIGQSSMNSPNIVHPLTYCDATDYSKISSGCLMSSYRLFGVDLMTQTETKDPMEPISHQSKISTIPEEFKFDHFQTLMSPADIRSKQLNSNRSRIKVQMQGVAIGRAVDLTLFDGYNQLIDELEKLFDLKDELRTRNQWEMVFADDEGDMMLVGDDPWPEFCNMVKKIVICSKEKFEIKELRKKSSESDSTLTTTVLACSDLPPDAKTINNLFN